MALRKKYDRDLKLSVAKAIVERKASVPQLVAELGLSGTSVRRWAKDYEELGSDAFPGNGVRKRNKDFEIAKLKIRIEELEMECDLLKNYQAFVNKKHP